MVKVRIESLNRLAGVIIGDIIKRHGTIHETIWSWLEERYQCRVVWAVEMSKGPQCYLEFREPKLATMFVLRYGSKLVS